MEEVSISILDHEVSPGLESLSDSHSSGEQSNSSPTLISSKIGQRAYRTAHRVQTEMLKHSKVVDSKKVEEIVRLDCDEVLLGDLLGSGQFCHVTQVHRIDFTPTEDEVSPRVKCQREDMHANSPKDKYAIKFLRNDLNPDKYCLGAAELVVEMHLLSSLNHPNIINLHAVSNGGPVGFQNGNVYFFLIDRLYNTLDQRLAAWRLLEQRQKPDAATKMSLLLQRLRVASDISSALAYLHTKKILYRAIDPTNLAFNDSGRIVLFDLGLARELDEAKLTADGINYELTGNKGNVLYMAPEVGTCQPYGMRADVYGMAVLLWQICTLAPSPFPGLTTREQYIERVVQNQERPKLNPSWPETLQYLIQSSWAGESSGRPPMKQFHRNLQHEIQDIQETMGLKKPPPTLELKEAPACSLTNACDPDMPLLLAIMPPPPPPSSPGTPVRSNTNPILRELNMKKWRKTPSEIAADQTAEESKTSLRKSLMCDLAQGRSRLRSTPPSLQPLLQRRGSKSRSRPHEKKPERKISLTRPAPPKLRLASTVRSVLLSNQPNRIRSTNNVVWKEQLTEGKTRTTSLARPVPPKLRSASTVQSVLLTNQPNRIRSTKNVVWKKQLIEGKSKTLPMEVLKPVPPILDIIPPGSAVA